MLFKFRIITVIFGVSDGFPLLCCVQLHTYEPRHKKTCLWEFPTKSDSDWSAQLQKLAWGFNFWLQKLETLHYLGSEQQRRWSDCADAQADLRLCCLHMTLDRFSHGPAHILTEWRFWWNRSLFNPCRLRYWKRKHSSWAATWQNQQNECASSEDSDQPGHPPSLIGVFAMRSMSS